MTARVVLIGTGTHVPGSGLPDVPAVAATLADLRTALIERCGIPAESITVLLDPRYPAEMGDALATAAEQAGDLLLVHYVGHGLVTAKGRLYLAAARTDHRPTRLAPTALSYDDLRDCVLDSAARSTVVILDCCFAGRATASLASGATALADLSDVDGGFVLTSAGREELALAPPGLRHTAFTGELIRLLTEGVPGGPEGLTLDVLFAELRKSLPAKGFPRPTRRGSGSVGGLVLAPNPAYGQPAVVEPVRRRWYAQPRLAIMAIMAVLAASLVVASLFLLGPPAPNGGPAPTTAALPDVPACVSGQLRGAGSGSHAAAERQWTVGYAQTCPSARIEYLPIGDGASAEQFGRKQADFVAVDGPLGKQTRETAISRCTEVRRLPSHLRPISVVYNLSAGPLRLSVTVLAKIFDGRITRWDDPDIKRENPGLSVGAQTIRPIHRSLSSGSTDDFTAFLAAAAPRDWKAGAGLEWPLPGGEAAMRAEDVAKLVERTPGAIAYLDWSYALTTRLPVAHVASVSGVFVELTAAAATKAIDSSAIGSGDDLGLRAPVLLNSRDAYPIVGLTYRVVCAKGNSELLKSYLAHTVSKQGQGHLAELGYAPLPEALRAKVDLAIRELG